MRICSSDNLEHTYNGCFRELGNGRRDFCKKKLTLILPYRAQIILITPHASRKAFQGVKIMGAGEGFM